ncbi:d338853d-0f66-4878-805d-cdefd1b85701-CDS [Sclerotinia trifoliorum]|uniref:D338853d-0f66-4878-805d-cdefd1b85701-CDS n=1 Tax=Sclerotinia trifoliorum TaxID=28548 RepID=A0A8H2W1X6_9HELO|nr:d338853d-0f66-4878-805d-cdefd1b85701-CDS [Sclerotinia trifoliorum]
MRPRNRAKNETFTAKTLVQLVHNNALNMMMYRFLYKNAVAAARQHRPNHKKASSSLNEPNASSLFTVRDITAIAVIPNSTPTDICVDINTIMKDCFVSVGLGEALPQNLSVKFDLHVQSIDHSLENLRRHKSLKISVPF